MTLSAARLAAISGSALDRPLAHDAELLVAEPSGAAVVLGAMQRGSEIAGILTGSDVLVRRASGGAEARVGPGSLWMQLALARSDALVACEPDRLLNRYVRPLLRALTKVGALAHYFDRDWISAAKRPVGVIAFAHDASSGRALVEAILGVSTPFAMRARSSYLGKEPATLAEIGAKVDVARLAEAVAEAYATAYGRATVSIDAPAETDAAPRLSADPPWAATREEAIGIVAAGRDRDGAMRVGGELMASRDAISRLESCLAEIDEAARDAGTGVGADAIGRALDETLKARGGALLGVKSLVSLRDVLLEAFARN
jgi:hypothetical protein